MIQLFVGLGNPGNEYEATRHNVGFWWVDALARQLKVHLMDDRNYWGRVGRTNVQGRTIHLLQPQTYMNLSGKSVSALARFFKISPESILVVHDELDIPFDALRLKVGGGHGGHNGVRDVAKALNTPDFPRVRVGIGRPPGRQDPADWVLQPFPASAREELALAVSDAADAVERLVDEGLLAAQQVHHAPRP